jgi:hypothetical protein
MGLDAFTGGVSRSGTDGVTGARGVRRRAATCLGDVASACEGLRARGRTVGVGPFDLRPPGSDLRWRRVELVCVGLGVCVFRLDLGETRELETGLERVAAAGGVEVMECRRGLGFC